MKELKRYFSYIGKYKAEYWSIFIMTLVTGVVLNLAYSYMNKLIFNGVEYGNYEMFGSAALLCGVLVVLKCLAPYRRYLQIRVVRKIVFDIKIRLFEKLMKMDFAYYERTHSADALKVLNWDANSLKDSYFSHVFWVSGRLVTGVSAVIAMAAYSPVMMAVAVSFCALTVYLSVHINRQIKRMDKEIQGKISVLTSRISDIITGFSVLKMCKGACVVEDSFLSENGRVLNEECKRANKAAGFEVVTFVLGILASFGTIGVGAYLVSVGELDYGTVMAVVSLQMGVSTMLQSFGSALTTFSSSLAKAGRVFDMLEAPYEEVGGECNGGVDGSEPVEMSRVSFGYGEGANVLEDMDMRVAHNEKVVLKGESGCGKSTLLKLLMGFYRAGQGQIRIYGRCVEEYSLSGLRNMITYIPQQSYLFEGSIRENIAMGSVSQVSGEQVEAAAKMAYAHEFIEQLPQGYDTQLTAGGMNLSVGQRQRIAIARAFLKNAPLILMDEPSSALDAHSEKMINRAIATLMENSTVIMVSHTANDLEGFDRTIIM